MSVMLGHLSFYVPPLIRYKTEWIQGECPVFIEESDFECNGAVMEVTFKSLSFIDQ